MGYQDSLACKIVAKNCCCCGRPLVDAKSVEIGIGPQCRKKYLYELDVPEKARTEANEIIHALAVSVSQCEITKESFARAKRLKELGFPLISKIFESNFFEIRIEVREHHGKERFFVRVPYSFKFNKDVKSLSRSSGKFLTSAPKSTRKVFYWVFSCDNWTKRKLYKALRDHYKGKIAVGPKGVFTI